MLLPELTIMTKNGYCAFEAKNKETGEYQEIFIRASIEELKALAKEVLLDNEGNPRLDEEGNPILFIYPFTYKE